MAIDRSKIKSALVAAAVILFLYILPSVILFAAGWQQALVVAGLAIITMFLIRPNQIEFIKLWDVELKLRKQNFEIEVLRKLIILTTKTYVSLAIRSGRVGGYKPDDLETLRSDFHSLLSEVMDEKTYVDAVDKDYHLWNEIDYVFKITNQTPDGISPQYIDQWKQLRTQTGRDRNPPKPEALEKFYSEAGKLSGEIKELIEDYRFYHANKRHRRPDVWRAS